MYGLSISYYDLSQLSIVQLDWNTLSSHLFFLINNDIYNRLLIVNGDLSSWNVSQVTDMSSMFYGANSFNSDLSSWNVSQVSFSSDYDTGANNWQSVNKPQF